MSKPTVCVWCWKTIQVTDDYDDLRNKGICSQSCRDAETIFMLWMSDEGINRRQHYKKLTGGGGG